MKKLPSFSIKRPISILMGVLIILILGIISLCNLTLELFPSLNLPYSIIATTYPGASPELIEGVVTKPIESSMATVSNIKNINSVSNENYSMIMLEFNEDTNIDLALIEMREKLDLISNQFPKEVMKPTMIKLNPNLIPITQFALSVKEQDLRATTNLVKTEILPKIESVPGVAQVQLIGGTEDTIDITLNTAKLEVLKQELESIFKEQGLFLPPLNINAEMLKGIIAGQNLEAPAGYLANNNNQTLVRIGKGIKTITELENLPIISNDLMQVVVADVATIDYKSNEDNSYSKVNGEDAIILSIQKQSNYATSKVIKALTKRLTEITEENEAININMLFDQGEHINLAINSVLTNLIYGALLAIIVLIFFLKEIKPTIIIGIAIPISVITTFSLIYFWGITLNLVSFGGLALGVGMLVDNAIVVIENIFRLRKEGLSVKEAAGQGAKQVINAITASTLTTIAVFLPIVFMEGMIAEVFKQLALTVSFSLLASLFVAITLVPMLASKMFKAEATTEIKVKTNTRYEKYLKIALKYKYIMLVIVLVLFGGSIWGLTKIGTEFIPEDMESYLMITLDTPKEATFQEKRVAYDQFTEKVMTIAGVETVAGSLVKDNIDILGNNNNIIVLKEESSPKTYADLKTDILEATKELPFAVNFQLESDQTNLLGTAGVELKVKGLELETLTTISNDLIERMEQITGIAKVKSDLETNPLELNIEIDRELSIAKGLTNYQVFSTVQTLLMPNYKATDLNFNNRLYQVNVYPSVINSFSTTDLEALEIEGVPLTTIADFNFKEGWQAIKREQQRRYITINAELEPGYNIGLIGSEVKTILKDYETPTGYEVILGGENEEIDQALITLLKAALLAILLVYMVMAIQFESLVYPFIIMFTVPLAATGSFLALVITGFPLSMVAFIGMIILAGIVVNNGIILVDFINQLKAKGIATKEAVIKASNIRIRPILMTSLTTILALLVMAFDVKRGSALIRPMAITAIGGLVFATVLTLFIIPCVYVIIDNIKVRIKGGIVNSERK